MECAMYKKLSTLTLAAAIGLSMVMMGAAVADDNASHQVSDTAQEAQISSNIALSPYLRASELHVSAQQGMVTLTGTVTEEVNKDLAKQIALAVNGVKEVDNQIVVVSEDNAPATLADDGHTEVVDYESNESTAGKIRADVTQEGHGIADGWITTKVKSSFMYSRRVNGSDITVNTHAGVVSLRGRVNSDGERARAIELAQNVRGVRRVSAEELSTASGDISLVQGR